MTRYPKFPHQFTEAEAARLEGEALKFLWHMQEYRLHYSCESYHVLNDTIRGVVHLINHVRGMPPNSIVEPRIGDTRDIGRRRE